MKKENLIPHFEARYFEFIEKTNMQTEKRYINEQVFHGVVSSHKKIELFYRRASGFTTSAVAAALTFPHVYLVVNSNVQKDTLLHVFPLLTSDRIVTTKEAGRYSFLPDTVLLLDNLELDGSFEGVRIISGIGIEYTLKEKPCSVKNTNIRSNLITEHLKPLGE